MTPRSKAQKSERDQKLYELHQLYREVFSTPAGKRVLDHICKGICLEGSIIMDLSNPLNTYQRATQQDIANRIRRMVEGIKVED